MCNIPGSRLSPEIVAGELRFCQGDTFTVTFFLDLRDQDGTPVDLKESDVVTLQIFNRSHEAVETVTYTGIPDSQFSLVVTDALSKKMPAGQYTYRICVHHAGEQTTVAWENKMIVR